ncbi:MAG: SRPBCC family protein [Chloroflexota bacterium]
MAHVKESIVIPAPMSAIFDVIADDRRALEWMEGFSRFELLPGPTNGVGARVRAAGTFLGFTVETELEISEYERPNRLVSRSSGPIKALTTWLLSEDETGTRVTFSGDYILPLPLRLAGDRAFEQLVAGQIRHSLVNLRHLC